MDKRLHVFIDESGDENLDLSLEGTQPYFCIACIIVREDALDKAREIVAETEGRHFGNQGLKSSSVGSSHERRLSIIQSLEDSPHKHVVTIVNKADLLTTGPFQFKKTFRKYFIRQTLEKIHEDFYESQYTLDQHGDTGFQSDFTEYLHSHLSRDLFDQYSIEFADDEHEPLLRLADFVAGTCRIITEDMSDDIYLGRARQLLRKKEIAFNIWPFRKYVPKKERMEDPGAIDEAIRLKQFLKAFMLMKSLRESAGAYDQMQLALLEYLVSNQQFEQKEDRSYFLSRSLASHIGSSIKVDISEQAFRTKIVAPLRDEGLLFAGGSNGIRIVTCLEDIDQYVEHVGAVVSPMIGRLKKARESILLLSAGDVDILDSCAYPILLRAIEDLE